MKRCLQVFSGAVALQVLLAAVIPIITATRLDANGECLLNLTGTTCLFVEITCGFSLLFSALLAVGSWWAARRRPAAAAAGSLHEDCASLAGFAALWWFAAAMTASLRGAQASAEGMAQGGARGAVIALSWLQLLAFLAAWAAVQCSRLARSRAAALAAKRTEEAEEAAAAAASAGLGKGSSGALGERAHELPLVAPPAAMVTVVVA